MLYQLSYSRIVGKALTLAQARCRLPRLGQRLAIALTRASSAAIDASVG